MTNHLVPDLVGDPDAGRARTENDDSLLGPAPTRALHGIEQPRQHYGTGALHVVIEGRDLVPVPAEDAAGIGGSEVLPVEHGGGEQLGRRGHIGVDEVVIRLAADAPVPVAHIERIVQELFVVRTDIQHHWYDPVRIDTRRGRVDRELAYGNVDAVRTPIANAVNFLRVAGHKQIDVVRRG